MRRHARILIAAVATTALLAVPAAAAAHVELTSSTPAPGDNLETAPSEVTITFNEELDPDSSTFTVADADGNEVGSGEVDLGIADRNVLSGTVSISDPGVYTVSYEVAGLDGHPIEGSFSFGFDTDEEIPEPTGGEDHENPDTALPRPEIPLATLLGMLLLGLAAATAVRRLALR